MCAFTLPLWLQLHSSLVLIYFSLLLVEISAFDFGYIADSELRILPGLLACFILQHSALFLVLSKLVKQVWHKSNFGSVSTLLPTCGEIYTLYRLSILFKYTLFIFLSHLNIIFLVILYPHV